MEDKVKSPKMVVKIAGLLFLVQIVTASIAHSALLVPLLSGDNFLMDLSAHSHQVILAMLLDLSCGASVFGIGVLLFPILKKYSEPIALWHLGFRFNEWVMLTISGIFLLTLVAISKEYVAAAISEQPFLEVLGHYILKARGYTKILMLLGFCLSASLFYFLLFKSRLLPGFISIWGMIGIVLLFAEVISNIYGQTLGGIKIMLPMGLNEIFLGFWLIFKGFNLSPISPDRTS